MKRRYEDHRHDRFWDYPGGKQGTVSERLGRGGRVSQDLGFREVEGEVPEAKVTREDAVSLRSQYHFVCRTAGACSIASLARTESVKSA